MISIFDEAGMVNAEVGGAFAGLDRFEARKAVKARLAELGLERGSKPHVHAVGHCQRCETVVEPMLSTQWFVKMEPLAKPAIEAVEQGKTSFVPESWSKTYFHWMRNIRDWCISRQLWWGHRIPAWYCGTCQRDHRRARDRAAMRAPTAAGRRSRQDEDVLDTWFSSWLWPFATLGWPNETRELKTFYPTTVLDTGYDILFFWVARMMMAGLHFMKKVPFRTVYLHTMVTDEKGEKMSKVKGNTIDPVDVIDKHGADALRFALAWLTTQAAQGKNIKFSISNVEDARRFANKIWNATRFALMNLEGYDPDRFADRTADGPDSAEFDLPERWILSRVQRAIDGRRCGARGVPHRRRGAGGLSLHLGRAVRLVHRAGQGRASARERRRSRRAGKSRARWCTALETAMRLLHPFMPFLTEEIWQQLPKPQGAPQSIMITLYPIRDVRFVDDAREARWRWSRRWSSRFAASAPTRTSPSSARIVAVLTVGDDYKKTILEGYKQHHRRAGALRARCACDVPVRCRRTRSGPWPRRWRARSRWWCRWRDWSIRAPSAPSWRRSAPRSPASATGCGRSWRIPSSSPTPGPRRSRRIAPSSSSWTPRWLASPRRCRGSANAGKGGLRPEQGGTSSPLPEPPGARREPRPDLARQASLRAAKPPFDPLGSDL